MKSPEEWARGWWKSGLTLSEFIEEIQRDARLPEPDINIGRCPAMLPPELVSRCGMPEGHEDGGALMRTMDEWVKDAAQVIVDREKRRWKAEARREALAMDQPWSVPDVLAKLADAADHLLSVHDCDHLHYERVYAARDAARGYLAALAAKERTP